VQIFARIVEDKWEIPLEAAISVCSRYERGDSIYFLSEYPSELAAYGIDVIAEIYSFLDLQKELEPLREQARKTLKSANLYDESREEDISLSISKTEIDDIVSAFRINSQSKGRAAITNGLLPLAELFEGDFSGDVNAEAKKYIDKSKGLESADDVIDGIVAILTDRIAFDGNARYLVRDITANEGNFEVTSKKKSAKYDKFCGQHNFSAISDEDLLFLQNADENKDIKFSVVAPVLYGLELLKHHFLPFPDSSSAQIVNRAIVDAWNKFLAPMAQNSTKDDLLHAAQERVSRVLSAKIREALEQKSKTVAKNVLIISQDSKEIINIIVANYAGECFRVSQEDVRNYGKPFNSAKIKNVFEQWRASEFILIENPEYAQFMSDVISITTNSFSQKPAIRRVDMNKKTSPLLKNEFVKKQIKDFDKNIQNAYTAALMLLAPAAVIYEPQILEALTQNPVVNHIGEEKMKEIVDRNLTLSDLGQGIEIGEKNDKLLLKLGINEKTLENLQKAKNSGTLKCKYDIRKIDGINDVLFVNISGFVIFPKAGAILEKTLVHPLLFDLPQAVADSLNVSLEDMLHNEKLIAEYECENPTESFYVREKLAKQLKAGAKYASFSSGHNSHHRTGWRDIPVGSTTYGRVRNITDFGIFVDINATTDGLVHISEVPPRSLNSLKIGDKIHVKILDVDSKKRRIALTMKFQTENIGDLLSYFNENA